jgi:Lon protease-like protein
MMRRAMDGNRQFGMVMYNRSGAPQGALGPVHFMEYGTTLEITNMQILDDGRSYVETRGVGRFRIKEYSMLDGYYVGRVERVEDVSLAEEERLEAEETTSALAAALDAEMRIGDQPQPQPQSQQHQEIPPFLDQLSTRSLLVAGIEFIERMRANSAPWLNERILIAYGGPPADPALFPYWFASVLPIADDEKYLLLQSTSVRERLKIVNRWILRIERQRLVNFSRCPYMARHG